MSTCNIAACNRTALHRTSWSGFGVLLMLSGCGGSDDPASGTLIAGAASCEIAEGADHCTVQVTWASQNATSLHLQPPSGGQPSAVAAGGVLEVAVPAGGGSALLIDDGLTLASIALSAQCTVRSAADSAGVCQPTPLYYSNKVYASYGLFSIPFAVGSKRATLVNNRTGLALDELSADCRLSELPAPSGRIGVVCATDRSGSGPWYRLYIDPIEDALYVDPDKSPVNPPEVLPFVRPPIPQELAAYVANGAYYGKGGVMTGPYVTFGSGAGQDAGITPTSIIPLDYYFYIGDTRLAFYFASAREGGLLTVPKNATGIYFGTEPSYISKEGWPGIPCRTCTTPSPTVIRSYTHLE